MKAFFFIFAALTTAAFAVDTTPPSLDITHTWIEKRVHTDGKTYNHFMMHLDPRDDVGMNIDNIIFRSALNTTTIPAAQPWQWMPWTRGEPFDVGFICTACVIEIRARDAAGNLSPVQKRVFTSPFPYTSAPNTKIQLQLSGARSLTGPALDCRGLFNGKLDDTGSGDDILEVDRTTGNVTARRQETNGWASNVVATVSPNTIEDSAAADVDGNGKLDFVMLVNGALRLYLNSGLDGGNVLTYTESTLNAGALNAMNLTTFTNVAFADISGEGRPEMLVSGTDGSGNARIGWLDNNAINRFLSGNNALAPAGSGAGRLAAGDVTGDGFLDVVMVNPVGKELILFKNDAGTRLGGEDDVVTSKRPDATSTGFSFDPLPAHALAVGDVTGDGRADVVATIHWWGQLGSDTDGDHMHQFWQLFDSWGTAGLHAQPMQSLSTGPLTASPVAFASDVMVRDLTGDRFPEIILTSHFTADLLPDDDPQLHPELIPSRDPGVRVLQLAPILGSNNLLSYYNVTKVERIDTNTTNPHRLAVPRYGANKVPDIVAASQDATTSLPWIANVFRESTAPVSIEGGVVTDTDPDGTEVANGGLAYTVYPNGLIEYSLTITNNTVNPLTNAIFDSLLPPSVTIEDNGGGTEMPSGTSKFLRWTETIPANTSINKHFTARMVPTAVIGAIIQPKNTLKYGTTTLYSYMPKVTLDEPITFALLSVKSDSDAAGSVVRFGEDIYYRARLTNRGKTAITNTIVSMNIPANTKFSGPVTPVPNTTQVVSATRIDITVPSLSGESVQDLLIFVEAKGADNVVITNSTLTAQRPSGSKRTLAAMKTTIKPAIDIDWYSVYSEFSPGNQTAGEPYMGTQVHFGEIIRYRPRLINRSTIPQTNVLLKIPVPAGCIFFGPVSAIPGMTYTTPSNVRIEYTIANLPGTTYNLDGTVNTLSVNTDARLDVECRAADYANVTQSATTVQVPGRAIVNPGTYTFLCRPALEIDLKTVPANLTSIKPGETITYELQAKNWGINKVTSGKVISRIPYGTKLKNALSDDGSGTPAGPGPDMILGTLDDIPFRSGDFLNTPQLPHELSPTSKPAYILEDKLLVWELGQVDPGAMKTIRYSVTVATDIGKDYFSKAQLKTLTMDHTNYNFVGTANTGKRIFAFVPISPTYAAPANADPYWMNSATGKAPPVNIAISTSNPLPKPKLQIVKHVVGPRNEALPAKYDRLPTDQATADIAGTAVKKNDWIFYVENDTTVANDAICNYTLHYFNTGGATATNVRVKDTIPAGMTFVGFVAKDQVLMGSFPFSHFYDAFGNELNMGVPANVTKVRSFDLYGGNLAINESHAFSYQCVALDSQLPGAIITSKRGGKSGSNSGLYYTALPGYQLAADQLHFPVDGSPDAVHVKITAKASFHLLLKDGWKSGHGMASGTPAPAPRADGASEPVATVSEDDNDSITITMPYDVRGDAGAAPLPPLSNVKMSFILPKGYKTDDAYVNSVDNVKLKTLNASAVVEGSGYVSAIRQANGTIKVTFPLDDIPFAWPTAHIIYDPLYKSTLVDAKGYTKGGADIEVNLSGFYGAGGGAIYNATADATTDVVTTATPHGCLAGNWVQFTALNGGTGLTTGTPYVVHSTTSTTALRLAEQVGGAPIDITANATTGTKLQRLPDKAIPAVKSFIHIDSRADADKDTKLFIGRCAPVSVKRGEIFTYTLFFGTLASVDSFEPGEIAMTVPAGCEALSATQLPFNSFSRVGTTLQEYASKGVAITPAGTFYPAGTNSLTCTEVRYPTPKPANTVIKWSFAMFQNYGGAVQLKVRVLESFTGNSIVDNTCYFKSLNANLKKPGPSAVVVRDGDVDGQLAEILQRHLQGVKFKHNTGTTTEINKTLVLDESTCGISIGGADVLQFLNGVNLIPLPHDRVMLIGPPNNIIDAAGGVMVSRNLVNDPMLRIECGPGTSGAVSLVNMPGYTGVTPANQVLTDLGVPGLNVLAAKTANVLIGGGNNLVRSGGATFAASGLNGASGPVVLLPNASAIPVSQLISNGDVKLLGQDGASIVAGGGGNATTGQGGQMVSTGAGVVANDGAGVVANDGAGVIGQDAASAIANDGAGVVANDGAGLFSDQGAGLIGQDGAQFIGTGVGTLTGVNTGTGK